jgi:hypothetical protein
MQKILTIKPQKYLKQGPSHCGAYSVKAILEAFGKDTLKAHPKYYHPHWLGRLTGATLGRNYWVDVLKSFGINAQTKSAAKLSNSEKINTLKKLLGKDKPVMVRIGNGYGSSNVYNPTLAHLVMHWITIWGYDDKKQIFYVYDSALPRKYWDKDLPIGNTTRTYAEIIRDWGYGLSNPFYFLFMGRVNYVYTQIL